MNKNGVAAVGDRKTKSNKEQGERDVRKCAIHWLLLIGVAATSVLVAQLPEVLQ